MRDHEGSTFVRHVPCEACGSRDNAGLFSDGHTFCFGCGTYTPGDGSEPSTRRTQRVALDLIPVAEQNIQSLRSRNISEATCAHFGYATSKYKGKPVQVAPYYDEDGKLVAQKIRFPDKTFKVLGSLDTALPFGSRSWQRTGKHIVVTEGEIDALSVSQCFNNKFPVVSIASGAGAQTRKYIAKIRDYLLGFERVVLMFDMDEPGRDAAKVAASVIGRRACIAELPLKDANEMLKAGRVDEIINAFWKAEPYRPEGIVDMATLKDAVKTPPTYGLSWPWERLTQLLYGIPERAIIALGGPTGGGKTDFLTQIMMWLVTQHKQSVGVFSLEQHVVETARRLAGKFAGKTFHVPDSGWTEADLDAAWDALMAAGKVFLYDSFGVNEWDSIKEKIEYLCHAEGVRYFFVDNLTALAAAEDDEKTGLERIMSEMGSMVQRLDITIFLVSHLATPEGKPHEEGGRVMIRHFKGSRSIGFWSYVMLGLERNQQAEDPIERSTTTLRVLKDRKTGRATGEVVYLGYDMESGMLFETTAPEERSGAAHGFTDEEESTEAVPSDF